MFKLSKLTLVALAAVSLLGVACGEEDGDSGAQEQTASIEAFDNYFEPTSFQFEPGAEVTLTLENGGSVAHSVTAPDLDLEIEAQSGDTVDSTFSVPSEVGTFDFYCKFHPDEMKGTISIGGSDQPLEEDVDTEDDDEDVDVEVDEDEDSDASGTDEDADY